MNKKRTIERIKRKNTEPFFLHITANTGHIIRSFRHEVDLRDYSSCRKFVDTIIKDDEYRFSSEDGYFVSLIHFIDGEISFSVAHKSAPKVRLLDFTISCKRGCMWDQVFHPEFLHIVKIKKPTEPNNMWIVTRITPHAMFNIEADGTISPSNRHESMLQWISELESAMAWAWYDIYSGKVSKAVG